MLKLIQTLSAKRRVVAELSRLSDRALADLGIARTEIAAIAATAVKSQDAATDRSLPRAGHRHVPAWA